MDENVRQRKLRRLLRISFPDGKVLCFKSATMTFVEALSMIGSERFQEVKLESYHLPLISQEIYPRFKEWMKPIGDGWYVNTQSDSDQKYMQLVSIKQQLGLDWKIEVGSTSVTLRTATSKKLRSIRTTRSRRASSITRRRKPSGLRSSRPPFRTSQRSFDAFRRPVLQSPFWTCPEKTFS